ncbi:MAG: hypothetical protein GY774_00425 [Planctomycetes bacterium]|nr:hypothetical protein [Planctomycetota bacterium]
MIATIRYISAHPSDLAERNCSFELKPNSDVLTLDILNNSMVIYPRPGQVDTDLMILKCLIGRERERVISEQTEIANPVDDENALETVQALDIEGRVFRTLAEVKKAHPKTAGTITVTDTAEDGTETTRTIPAMDEAASWNGVG